MHAIHAGALAARAPPDLRAALAARGLLAAPLRQRALHPERRLSGGGCRADLYATEMQHTWAGALAEAAIISRCFCDGRGGTGALLPLSLGPQLFLSASQGFSSAADAQQQEQQRGGSGQLGNSGGQQAPRLPDGQARRSWGAKKYGAFGSQKSSFEVGCCRACHAQ